MEGTKLDTPHSDVTENLVAPLVSSGEPTLADAAGATPGDTSEGMASSSEVTSAVPDELPCPGAGAGFLSDPLVWQAYLAKQLAKATVVPTAAPTSQRLVDIVGFTPAPAARSQTTAPHKAMPKLPQRSQTLLEVVEAQLSSIRVAVTPQPPPIEAQGPKLAPIVTASVISSSTDSYDPPMAHQAPTKPSPRVRGQVLSGDLSPIEKALQYALAPKVALSSRYRLCTTFTFI